MTPRGPAPARAPASPCGKAVYWRLSETVTACVAADRILFLDLARDRYFALPPVQNDLLIGWLNRPDDQWLAERCRAALSRSRILDPRLASTVVPAVCAIGRPSPIDSEPLKRVPVRPGSLSRIAKAVVSAWRDVRSNPLATVLARRTGRDEPSVANRSALQLKLAEFRSARPLIPVPRVCLHDCLALIDWLGPQRAGVELVLGVSALPFAAHCWVQADGRVLDDHPESPSRYQPILHIP